MAYVYRRPWVRYRRKRLVTATAVVVTGIVLRTRRSKRIKPKINWRLYKRRRFIVTVPSVTWLLNRYKKLRGLKRNQWRWKLYRKHNLGFTKTPSVVSLIVHNLPFFSTMGMFKSF